jgi:predicted nucleotidyltransferase
MYYPLYLNYQQRNGAGNMESLLLSIDIIKLTVKSIAKEYGVKKVYLFGSYAKNTATKLSDLDLLIEKGKPLSLLDLSGMRMKFEDKLNVPIDLITTDGTKAEFNSEISGTEVLIYEE